jgi:hypothetical protein
MAMQTIAEMPLAPEKTQSELRFANWRTHQELNLKPSDP